MLVFKKCIYFNDDQTVNLRDPLTMAPVSDEPMCRKY